MLFLCGVGFVVVDDDDDLWIVGDYVFLVDLGLIGCYVVGYVVVVGGFD